MSLGDGNGNGVGEAKVKEVLNFCLSSESPEFQAKVYKIIALSGLEPSDPMFLVLALSGQMRVFLEAAPKDLGRLLTEWKNQSASSLAEIATSIASIEQAHQKQAEVIRANMEAVSLEYVESIKEVGMATTSAIAEANSETLSRVGQTLEQNRHLKSEIVALEAKVEAGRKESVKIMNALISRLESETESSNRVQKQMNSSYSAIKGLQQKTFWLKWADWFSPLLALAIVGGAGFMAGGWLTYQKYNSSVERFGRKVVNWNLDRIVNCQKTDNPECTFWIVPPGSPLREKAK
ncbi:MAG: DUF6753 family protein [Cyanobacteria bacterium J06555_3]